MTTLDAEDDEKYLEPKERARPKEMRRTTSWSPEYEHVIRTKIVRENDPFSRARNESPKFWEFFIPEFYSYSLNIPVHIVRIIAGRLAAEGVLSGLIPIPGTTSRGAIVFPNWEDRERRRNGCSSPFDRSSYTFEFNYILFFNGQWMKNGMDLVRKPKKITSRKRIRKYGNDYKFVDVHKPTIWNGMGRQVLLESPGFLKMKEEVDGASLPELDWKCEVNERGYKCGQENPGRRSNCTRCGSPRPAHLSITWKTCGGCQSVLRWSPTKSKFIGHSKEECYEANKLNIVRGILQK